MDEKINLVNYYKLNFYIIISTINFLGNWTLFMRNIIIYFIIILANSNFSFCKLDSLDYKVYSTVIEEWDKYPNNDTLLIYEIATDSVGGLKFDWDWKRMRFNKNLKNAFVKANQEYDVFNRNFNLKKPYKFYNNYDFVPLSDTLSVELWWKRFEEAWDNFHKKFVKTYGIINLSKIGYNKNKTKQENCNAGFVWRN